MTVGFVFYSEYWQTVMMKIEIPKCTVSSYSGWRKVYTKLFSCTKTHSSYTRKLKGEITKPNPKHNWLCKDRVHFLSIHPQETDLTIYFPLIISANLRDTICLHKCAATTVILHSLWDIVYELWQGKARSKRIPNPPWYSLMVASDKPLSALIVFLGWFLFPLWETFKTAREDS